MKAVPAHDGYGHGATNRRWTDTWRGPRRSRSGAAERRCTGVPLLGEHRVLQEWRRAERMFAEQRARARARICASSSRGWPTRRPSRRRGRRRRRAGGQARGRRTRCDASSTSSSRAASAAGPRGSIYSQSGGIRECGQPMRDACENHLGYVCRRRANTDRDSDEKTVT